MMLHRGSSLTGSGRGSRYKRHVLDVSFDRALSGDIGAEWLDTDGIGIQTTSDLHKSRNAAYGHAITKSGHAPGPRIRHLRDGARTRTGGLSLSVSAPPRPHDELEKTRYPSRMPEGVAQSGMSS